MKEKKLLTSAQDLDIIKRSAPYERALKNYRVQSGNFLVQQATAADIEQKWIAKLHEHGFFADGGGLLHDCYTVPADRADEFLTLWAEFTKEILEGLAELIEERVKKEEV